MNKRLFAKLYKEMSEDEITVKTALKNIEDFMEILEKALLIDGKVKLVKKGTFEIVERKPRRISNPQTRDIMEIQPKKIVKFRPSKKLNFKKYI